MSESRNGNTRGLAMLQARLAAIDNLLDHGSQGEARGEIQALVRARRWPRALLAELARCARRARLSDLASRLLHRRVRTGATDDEIIQYASSLDDIGASREAIVLLKQTSDHDQPEVLLHLGFAYMNLWEYDEAIAVL